MVTKPNGIFPVLLSFIFLTPTEAACPNGDLVGRNCLEFYPEIDTFGEARAACEQKNSHLVVVKDAEVNQVLQDRLLKNGMNTAYIGLQVRDGELQWTSGTPLNTSSFVNWETSPVVGDVTQCGFMHESGTWHLDDCTAEKGFMCERV